MSTGFHARRRIALLGTLVILAGTFLAQSAVAASELPGQFAGSAYGNKGNAKSGELSTRLGRAAYQGCPCHGTGGKIISNSVDDVDGGDSYRAGKVVSTAQAMKQDGMRAFAQTTSRVTNMRALGGLIKADSMYAVATVRATITSINVTPDGSAITGLRVNGHSQTADPGQRIDIPGFGYVVFYDVQRSGDGLTRRGIQVEMMRIVITRENDLDIPVGSVLTSAHANVAYTRLESGSVVSAAAWGSQAKSTSNDVENGFGRSAPAYLGCFGKGTSSGSNRVESQNYPGTFSAGQVVSNVYGSVSADVATASATNRMEAVNLLDGVMTADVIKGAASATVDGLGGHTSFSGSKFVNLQIMGTAVGDSVAPNTEVSIPGLGTMTLFATDASHDADDADSSVFMVILDVTVPNSQGIPVGSQIRLAHARAGAHP
jgi:hypothetical protein